MSDKDGNAPTVFISSTNIDLKVYRKEAAMAALAAGILADLQENWTAENHPPLDACLERVRKADALVVIVAHRYGWVPEDPKHNPEGKSITWLECEEAAANKKHVLAFVVDESTDWPAQLKDEAELKRAMEMDDDEAADALIKATRKRAKGLRAFKQWLDSRGLRRTFRTKEELKLEVERALQAWRPKKTASKTAKRNPPPRLKIPSGYQEWLERECADLTFASSLKIQQGQALRLTHLYVPAIVSSQDREPGRLSDPETSQEAVLWDAKGEGPPPLLLDGTARPGFPLRLRRSGLRQVRVLPLGGPGHGHGQGAGTPGSHSGRL